LSRKAMRRFYRGWQRALKQCPTLPRREGIFRPICGFLGRVRLRVSHVFSI
jgi:hypothetical protein